MIEGEAYDVINKVPMTTYEGLEGSKLHLVNTMPEWRAFFELLMKQNLVACDTETSGFKYHSGDQIIGMSFGWDKTHFYIPVRHVAGELEPVVGKQLNMDDIRDDLIKFFSRKDVFTLWHNCMAGDSMVTLADGTSMRIDRMVKEQHPGPVLTVNEETGVTEAKKVVNWLKGDLRDNEEWLRISSSGKSHISCTIDHEIITARGRVRADEIVVGDKVATSLPRLGQIKYQLLLGTLLGDSSIVLGSSSKSPHLSCSHKDKDFAQFKASLFGGKVTRVQNNRGFSSHKDDSYSIFKATTKSDVRLQDMHNLVAPQGKKRLNEKWINAIELPAVAMWYCDDGWLESGRYPKIVTELDHTVEPALVSRLRELGLTPSVWWRNDSVANITLQQKDLALLAEYVPLCMERKLPPQFRGGPKASYEDAEEVFYTTVDSVSPLFTKKGRKGKASTFSRAREYCIAVEGNHNFFVNSEGGMCVSNCKFDKHFYSAEGIPVLTPYHDTRLMWQLFNENAPGALKTIASGWRDIMGRWHTGLVGKGANEGEKLISEWRGKEAKARQQKYRDDVMASADFFAKEVRFQGWKRVDIKNHVKKEVLHAHPYKGALKEHVHYGFIPIPLMAKYAATDTYLTWKIYEHTLPYVTVGGLKNLYINELKLSNALGAAEEHGIRIDRNHLQKAGDELADRTEQLHEQLVEELGPLNFNSTKQLTTALQNKGVVFEKKTPSGSYSLDKQVLEKLQGEYPIVSLLLEYRAAGKLKSTYVDGIMSKLTPDDVLHCSFNQNVATGRMSSGNPNLQNIPRKDKLIRKAFVPWDDDYVFLFIDYSQIEVRLTAHYSQDPLLLDAYVKGHDIHTRTMCEMFGYDYDEVNHILKVAKDDEHPSFALWDSLRSVSKVLNFGIIYGVHQNSLSQQIIRPDQYADLSEEEWINVCGNFIDSYLDKYRGVRKFINRGGRAVARECQVINHFGRIRHLPHARAVKITKDDSYKWMEARAKRQGVNFLVQGTAADLFKIAVVRIHNLLQGKKTKLVSFVHDEVQIYLHKSELHLLPEIKHLMEDFDFSVPIIADVAWSTDNWAAKKEL